MPEARVSLVRGEVGGDEVDDDFFNPPNDSLVVVVVVVGESGAPVMLILMVVPIGDELPGLTLIAPVNDVLGVVEEETIRLLVESFNCSSFIGGGSSRSPTTSLVSVSMVTVIEPSLAEALEPVFGSSSKL